MRKLSAAIRKEVLQLLADRVGLLVMFLMPVILVFVITVVQNSTFELVSENRIKLLVANEDSGSQSDSLIALLRKSGSFELEERSMSASQLKNTLLETDNLLGIYFPSDFSAGLEKKASAISGTMLMELGVTDSLPSASDQTEITLQIFYDPVLQSNYRLSLESGIRSYLSLLENKLMLNGLYDQLGYDQPSDLAASMKTNQTDISSLPAGTSSKSVIPNATQHNIPAWSIFAMFFMVVALGSNVVRERKSGTFVRILLAPTSFYLVLFAKMLVFLFVALLLQVVIFSIGVFIFPLIDLPALQIPTNIPALAVISLLSALSAVSYAILIGTLSSSTEQSNGFGSVSIILFAAIGGIWVPTFVMPHYLQQLAVVSPLHWCLDGFYTLFLQGGNWRELLPVILFLTCFSLLCQLVTFFKLKQQKFI